MEKLSAEVSGLEKRRAFAASALSKTFEQLAKQVATALKRLDDALDTDKGKGDSSEKAENR